MLTNLLTNSAPEGYQEVSISTSTLYALIGFLVVFAGITFLIAVIWLVGKIMSKNKPQTAKTEATPTVAQKSVFAPVQSDALDDETVAVIMAALTAYYEKNNPKCEFTVKRIKRIRRNNYA